MLDISRQIHQTDNLSGPKESGSASDGSSSSSMSIYDRYPNLPIQLREIVEHQTFHIANMQAEVKALKE